MEDVSLHPAEYLLVLSYSGSEWSFVIKNSLSNARSTTEVNKFHGPLCTLGWRDEAVAAAMQSS